ncbi:MAG: zinc ribbon domain-containing protein [Candidatus Omnitrophica bacterium]|nr:zinc ribbon domain-containing protein [Candidatus Omnitrophota bacterium]
MALVRYVCTHCQHRFEAEEKENLDCPNCLWSTSVKKEEDMKAGDESLKSESFGKIFPLASLWPRLRFFLIIAAGLALLVFFVFSGVFKKSADKAVEIKPDSDKKEGAEQAPVLPGLSSLSEEEKALLYGRVEISANRPVSEEEKKILEQRVSIETGLIEKLPSQAWTLENFKQVIAEQEKFYKITLPNSYKKKLEEVFRTHYLAAAEAFKAGELLKARDLWVESLALPIYGNDVAKHRGVVLTMLRVFINDTLSKIGAVNGTLVEKDIREKEEGLSRAYQELGEILKKQAWPAAFAKVQEVGKMMEGLSRPELLRSSAPPYPAAIRDADQGIQSTLFNILTPPTPSVVDLTPIEKDILAKKQVIQGFLPENLAPVQKVYEEALQLIRDKRWNEAAEKLKEISYPPALAKDAQEKIKILQKLA